MRALSLRNRFLSLLQDPPPEYLFELSEAGIAHARRGRDFQIGFTALPPGVLAVSPLQDNVLQPDILAAQVEFLPEEISPGLSSAMAGAVSSACETILQLLSANGRAQGDHV